MYPGAGSFVGNPGAGSFVGTPSYQPGMTTSYGGYGGGYGGYSGGYDAGTYGGMYGASAMPAAGSFVVNPSTQATAAHSSFSYNPTPSYGYGSYGGNYGGGSYGGGYGGMGGYGMGMGFGGFGGGYGGLAGMADMGMGYGMMGSGSGAGASYSAHDLHDAAAADPGVVVKTPAKGKRTRGVRNYGSTKAKYCGCC